MEQEQLYRVSFINDDDFITGGLLNNERVEFRNCHWDHFTYPGVAMEPVIAFHADLHLIGPDGKADEEVAQAATWSAGKGHKFIPLDDGRYLGSNDPNAKLIKGTNFDLFRQSCTARGFKPNEADAFSFNGLQALVVRVPAPERNIQDGGSSADGKRKPEVLVISEIIKAPGKSGAAAPARRAPARSASNAATTTAATSAKGQTTTTSTTNTAPAQSSEPGAPLNPADPGSIAVEADHAETATNIINAVLEANAELESALVEDFTKELLRVTVKAVKNIKDRSAINALLKDSDFLATALEAAGFMTNGETVYPAV